MPLPSNSLDAVKRLWPALKWGMFLVVLVFVVWHGWQLWIQFDERAAPLKWGWLALATVVSQIVWVPSLWYWRELMVALAAPAPWPQVARAYFCGTLGKYVPGKGVAIVIRSALLKDCAVPAATASLTVVVETLTFVWVGTLLALFLYPTMAPHLPRKIDDMVGHPTLRWGVTALTVCGGLLAFAAMMRSHGPLTDWFHGPSTDTPADNTNPKRERGSQTAPSLGLRVSIQRLIGHRQPNVLGTSSDRLSLAITLVGFAGFVAAWWLQGLALGLTIHAVSAKPWNWNDWPFWTGSSAVAMVGGFLAFFAPGGLGVREGLLMELLEHQLGPREAVLVALLLRGVSLVGEILVALALYYGVGRSPKVEDGG